MMSWDSEEMKLICGGSYLQTEKHDGARTDSVNKVLDICEVSKIIDFHYSMRAELLYDTVI